MAKPRVSAGGGLPAVFYSLKKGREVGGYRKLYRSLRSRNTCKTCALGMGGQHGGMVNEAGHFPEVCKKSIQAQAADMAPGIPEAWFRANPIERMATLTSREFEALGRLTFPVAARAGDTHFRRVLWDEGLDLAAGAFAGRDPSRVFFYASGRSSNEAAFLMQLVARAFGTQNVHNCSYYCHAASGVALESVYGSGAGSVQLEDLAQADLAVVAGANPASNHPRLITQLAQLRRRGGRVIVVNPLRETGLVRFRIPSDVRSMLFGSEIASLYLQPHIGSDGALFLGILKALDERGAVDSAFIEAHTEGWEAAIAPARAASWDSLVEACGVSRAEIDQATEAIARAKRGIFLWAMGLTHHANGVETILALANVALARGWLGRPGAGLLPIRGHSNVQGVGSVGVTPALKGAFAARLEELYGIAPAESAGQHTYASMEAAAAGNVDAAFLMGGNLFSSNPDRAWAAAALQRIPVTVSVTTKLNEGHVHGRGRTMVILPALARDEESQATTQESMFSFVRFSEGGAPSQRTNARSEVEIVAALAERILPPGRFDWAALRSHRHLRESMARVVPGYAPMARLDDTRVEFPVEGRAFREPSFATPGGRARFHATRVDNVSPQPGEFRLMTIRSEGQFNTVVYEEEDLYRGNRRRDVVMMAAEDADRLGFAEGSSVTVTSEIGSMTVAVAIVAIRPGNLAMYYPEANAIVPRRLDPRSHTPAFKSVLVRLQPARDV
jgi:molybdopterin-dependent oxidoreductase alpha subunit